MSTALCNSVTKDNGILLKSVTTTLKSVVVAPVSSDPVSMNPVPVDSVSVDQAPVNIISLLAGDSELAYKYNGKPFYKSYQSPPTIGKNLSDNALSAQANYTQAVCTVDWLSLTFCVSLPTTEADMPGGVWQDSSGRFGIKLDDRKVPHYRFFGFCYLDGVQFAEISFCPYDGSFLHKNHSNYALLKLDNQLFYSNEWLYYVEEFKAITGAVLNNVSRLDIAIDYSYAYGARILDFIRSIKREDSRYRKTGNKNLVYSHANGYDDSFKVGKRTGNKYAVFYNKSLEIKQQSNKYYIAAYHASNGLDTTQDVFRFEVRLDSQAVKSVAGFSLSKLADVAYLVSIVKTHMRNWFEFVPVMVSNVSRAKRFDILALDSIACSVTYLDRVKRKVRSNVVTAKRSVKFMLEWIYIRGMGDRAYFLQALRDIVDGGNLQDWLNSTYHATIKSLDKKLHFICDPAVEASVLASALGVPYAVADSEQCVA